MTAANEERFIFELAGEKIPVYSFSAEEKISDNFSVNLTLASESEISFDKIGSYGLLTMKSDDQDRYLHGLIKEISQHNAKGKYKMYSLTLVPDLWLLTLRSNVRIFQKKNTVDIIKQVLKDAGISPKKYSFTTQTSYSIRDYCVQYRETDYDFISRLMEEEGIYFFFDHTKTECKLIFSDAKATHKPISGTPDVDFITRGALTDKHTEYVTSIKKSRSIKTGKITIKDYNFEKPSYQLKAENSEGKFTTHEDYDYPGYFYEDSVGKIKSTASMEHQGAFTETYNGESLVPRFIPGNTFSLINHESSDLNIKYMLSKVSHSGNQPQVLEAVSSTQGTSYSCRFLSIPADKQYRTDKVHKKPSVEGVQTAIVTGPQGEEIYTDEHGRIKVQFHWDREGKNDDNSSCWMRVSQKWAGSGWGGVFIPRIGQEVIVDFIDGDPDRPLVTGCVYNGNNKPPYTLPDDKTKSTVKTESSPGGGGYNEMRFEDKKGEEEIYIQAEKDQNELVKNDKTTTIENDRTLTVTNNRTTEITSGNEKLTVKSGTRDVSVGGNETLKSKANFKHDVTGNYDLKVGGNLNMKVSGIVTINGAMIKLNP